MNWDDVNLNDMYGKNFKVVTIRDLYKNTNFFHNINEINSVYKEIIAEIVNIQFGEFPTHYKMTTDANHWYSYFDFICRMYDIGQYIYDFETLFSPISGMYEEEQNKLKKIWDYNETIMLRSEVDPSNHVMITRYNIAARNKILHTDKTIQRFKKSWACGIIRAYMRRSKWYWNVIENTWHPDKPAAKRLKVEYGQCIMPCIDKRVRLLSN